MTSGSPSNRYGHIANNMAESPEREVQALFSHVDPSDDSSPAAQIGEPDPRSLGILNRAGAVLITQKTTGFPGRKL